MNSRKYKDTLYSPRPVGDLRELINTSAELYSDRPAFFVKTLPGDDYRPVTYAQLKSDIDSLGTALTDMGLRGSKIAVTGENSYLWAVTYLAVTNGVGVIVPIDRELQPHEMANLMTRAGVSAVVYSRKLAARVGEAIGEMPEKPLTVCMAESGGLQGSETLPALISRGLELTEGGDRRYVDAEIDPDAMCALLFTSGTMGLAKGVMLSHRNIASNVHNMSYYVYIEPGKIGLSVLPMHHTYEMTCHILTGLYSGASLAICDGLKYILKNMREIHANVMLSVPLVFESMHKKILKKAVQNGSFDKLQRGVALSKRLKLYNKEHAVKVMFREIHEQMGNHMELFIAGGAAIDPEVIINIEAIGIPMIQGYGMTECAPIIALNRDRCSRADSAGKPLPGTEVRIIDEDDAGIGEIIVRSPSVMLGYYENEEATKETIIDGWLHTGDLGYMDGEGYLFVTGRKKSVIVTKNGKNIFPEELEFYLTQSEFIEEALVHGIDSDRNEDTVVKAEIFPNFENLRAKLGEKATDEEIRSFIAGIVEAVNERVPNYKRIKRFGIRMTEFVKTTTRKIKRQTAENLSDDEE